MTEQNLPIYTAEIKEVVDRYPYWDTLIVSVKENGIEIGTYKRNYSSLLDTFFPFCQDGEWYALYSPKYTSTRVMKLPECTDLGGEEDHENGFCPVGYFVPFGKGYESIHHIGKKGNEINILREKLSGKSGFVSGCVWGDDFSYKVQFLDLSDVKNGNIKRDDRFGYLELPRSENLTLKDFINLDCYDEDEDPYVEIATFRRFHLWDRNQKPMSGFFPLECEKNE